MAALAAINYPALLNGYPMLYSDSGTYIVAGFINYVPVDRPYFYSWFVRHTSLWYSLWLVLFAQSVVLLFAARMAVKYVLNIKNSFIPACLLLVGLGLLTGLSHNHSQIMADVFSPIALLAFTTLVSGKDIHSKHRFWLVVVLLFSISVHSSHLLIFSGLAVVLFIIKLIFKKKIFFADRRKAHNKLVFWGLASWLVVCLFNYWLGAGFKPSRTGNIFLVARCIETGAAKPYLDHNCPNAPADLCAAKDNLPANAVAFLWEYNTSPLYDSACMTTGWGDCWVNKDAAYGQTVKGILAYGPARQLLLERCVADSWKQLFLFDLGYLTPMAEGSPVYGGIKDFFGREMHQYQNAVQYNQTLHFETQSAIQKWVVYASLLLIVIFAVAFFKNPAYSATLGFALTVFIGCVVNGVVCASLSGVVDRYMARMIWLLPMAAALLVWQYIVQRKKGEATK